MMQKVRKAKTDPEALPSEAAGLEGRPEARNLVGIYAALADTSVDAVLRDHAGQGFGAFKPALGELLIKSSARSTRASSRLRTMPRRPTRSSKRAPQRRAHPPNIRSGTCEERVCQELYIWVGGLTVK